MSSLTSEQQGQERRPLSEGVPGDRVCTEELPQEHEAGRDQTFHHLAGVGGDHSHSKLIDSEVAPNTLYSYPIIVSLSYYIPIILF